MGVARHCRLYKNTMSKSKETIDRKRYQEVCAHINIISNTVICFFQLVTMKRINFNIINMSYIFPKPVIKLNIL